MFSKLLNQGVLDLDSLRPGYTDDPYSVLGELRQVTPARQVTVMGLRAWLITRYEDVRTAFTDPDISNDPHFANTEAQRWPQIAAALHGPLARSMSVVDGPDHGRLKSLLSKEFTPRRVAALRPRIEQICDDLLARSWSAGRADLVHDFAALLPLTVISELFGVPEEDRAAFRQWTLVVGGIDEGSVGKQPQAFADVGAYLNKLIADKRAASSPGDDLLSALIAVRDGTDRLSDTELLGAATVLLLAGHATTVNLITNAVLSLLRHSDQLAALRADPGHIAAVVEEALRFDGPVVNPNMRYTTRPVRFGDIEIPANEVLLLSIASANRDPALCEAPDVFDIHRPDSAGHLSFGHGIHYCIGAAIARLEAQVAIPKLLAHCPDLAVDETEPLRWRIGLPTRGLRHLPVTWRP
jgi:cytochrome P450